MWGVVHQFEGKARKRYHDDAAEWVKEWIHYGCWLPNGKRLAFSDGRILVRCKTDQEWFWNIMPGQKYVRQFNVDGGDTCTWRAKKELHEICMRYDLYVND